MLNEQVLDDPTRCPGCVVHLDEPRTERCRQCAILLTGPAADQLWQISVSAARLLRQREDLLTRMRAEARRTRYTPAPTWSTPAGAPAAVAPDPALPAQHTPAPASGPASPAVAPAPAPTPIGRIRESAEVGRRRVARIVLGSGVLLVVLAALVFVAVTWNHTGTAGRALVMGLALVLAAAGTGLAEQRELPATAEAMAALTVAMGLLDGYAAWTADLAGLRSGDALLVSAGTLLAVGGAAALGSLIAPLRALRISAALLLQGPLPLVIAWFGVERGSLLPLAIGLGAQAAVDVALLRRTYSDAARGLRIVAEVGVLCYWLAAVGLTLGEGAGGAPAGTMLALAALAGGIAYTLREAPVVRHLASGSAMVGALAAAVLLLASLPGRDSGESDTPVAWVGVALLAVVLVAMAPLFAVPREFRVGPLAVLVPLTVVPAFWVAAAPLVAVFGPMSWLGRPWSLYPVDAHARDALLSGTAGWSFGAAPLALLPLAVLTGFTALTLLRGRSSATTTRVIGAIAVGALLLVVPPALDLPLWAALGWHVAAAIGWACAGRVRPWLPLLALGHGGLALVWATAYWQTSIVIWAVGAAGLTLVAVLSPGRRAIEPNAAPAPADSTPTSETNNSDEPAQVGVDFDKEPQVVPYAPPSGARPSPGSGSGSGPALVLRLPMRRLVRPLAAGAALALALSDVAMATGHAGARTALIALAPAVLGALVALIAVALRPTARTTRTLTLVGGIGWTTGSLGAARAPGPLAVALAAGLAACVVGALRDRPAPRTAWAAVAALCWVGASAAGATAFGSDRPAVALAAVLAAALLFPLAATLAGPLACPSPIVLAVEAAAGTSLLVALLTGAPTSPVALAVATAAALCGARFGHPVLRPAWPPAAVVLFTATVPAALYRLDASNGATVLAAAGTAMLLYLAGARLPRLGPAVPIAAAAAVCAAGAATLSVAPELIWLVLAGAGLTASTTPAGPLRGPARVASVPLLFVAYWVRLALFDVPHPEAYTVPLGLALLVEGLRRRRANPDTTSWAAYGAPLAVLLLPSLPLAVGQGEPIRPSLLGIAAIGTLLVGARFRLRAPLFLGAGVPAIIGPVHLVPHLAPVYDAVPRWAILGTAGLLLIVVGAGYERRVRDLKRLRRAVGRLR
ncbi:SCO7613 C-terminal domain-containing membrane protein [Embleya sp. NPDC059237]|uniref:SCO7613 C-terminal domain-containing membrane protein n=1 Tax=Embleya sp. NPDC059237 TaxID=3346784 RepID=UPI003677C9A1